MIKRWMDNQDLVLWCGPCSTQRQAQELISGPNLARRATLLSINRTEPRAVIGLLTGHNTLRRQGWAITPFVGSVVLRRKPQSTSYMREALASLRHSYLGSFFLDPEDIRKLSIGAIWNFAKGTGLL